VCVIYTQYLLLASLLLFSLVENLHHIWNLLASSVLSSLFPKLYHYSSIQLLASLRAAVQIFQFEERQHCSMDCEENYVPWVFVSWLSTVLNF